MGSSCVFDLASFLQPSSRLLPFIMGAEGSKSNQDKEEKKSWVTEEINSNVVIVFSKTYCPYCRKAKDALKAAGLQNYTVYELDKRRDGEVILDVLFDMTGARTVPRVFVNGKFIGGGSETEQLQKSGKLRPMLEQCGAI